MEGRGSGKGGFGGKKERYRKRMEYAGMFTMCTLYICVCRLLEHHNINIVLNTLALMLH